MNSQSLTVVATLKAQPGRETRLRQGLLNLIPTTRHEPGCLNHDSHVATDNPAHFLFHRPFLVYMKKRGAPVPYFAMWVDNAELLRRWDSTGKLGIN